MTGFGFRVSTLNTEHSTLTLNTEHSTLNTQRPTLNTQQYLGLMHFRCTTSMCRSLWHVGVWFYWQPTGPNPRYHCDDQVDRPRATGPFFLFPGSSTSTFPGFDPGRIACKHTLVSRPPATARSRGACTSDAPHRCAAFLEISGFVLRVRGFEV